MMPGANADTLHTVFTTLFRRSRRVLQDWKSAILGSDLRAMQEFSTPCLARHLAGVLDRVTSLYAVSSRGDLNRPGTASEG